MWLPRSRTCMVVGGHRREWAAHRTPRRGGALADELGAVVAAAGCAVADAAGLRGRRRATPRPPPELGPLAPRRRRRPVHGDRRPGRRRPGALRRGDAPGARRRRRSTRRRSPPRCTRRPTSSPTSSSCSARRPAAAVAGVGAGLRRAGVPVGRRSPSCGASTSLTRRSTTSTAAAAASAAIWIVDVSGASTGTPASCCGTYKLGEADRIVVLLTERARQGARRRQGRAQDDVEVRRPAGADEPRAAAALPRARARHRQPGRVGRAAGAAARRPRPGVAGDGRAGGRRPAGAGAGAEPAAVPDARRRAAHDRRAAGRRSSVPAFYWKLLAAEGLRPELDACVRCGGVEPDVDARRLRPRRGRRAVPVVPLRRADLARRRSRCCGRSSAAGSTRPSPRRSRRPPTRSPSSPPGPSSTTSSAACAPSPCSNATDPRRPRRLRRRLRSARPTVVRI